MSAAGVFLTEKRKLNIGLAIAIRALRSYACGHDPQMLKRVLAGEEEPDENAPPCGGCTATLALYELALLRTQTVIHGGER